MIVLSDVHIITSEITPNTGKIRLTPSMQSLQEAVKQINRSNADIVIFTGDNIDSPDKALVVVFAKIISKLHKPYYVIPGNHDLLSINGVDKKEFYRLLNKFSANKIKDVPSAKTFRGGLVLIFMDGVNQYMPNRIGYFKEKDLIWLDKQLKKYKNRKVVIVQHFPVVDPNPARARTLYKQQEYLNLLEEHKNVIAIISGHEHHENEIQEDGILHISVPSLCTNSEYKQVDIEYRRDKTDYLIKSKIHSIRQE